VRFVITGEVSAIYKKGGRVRKVHLLLLLPSLEAAQRLSQRLGRLGNVTADGRPILGLDAKHILELALEAHPDSLVIPAHIWTPWFSVLGSKSGFDAIEECFEDLTGHIYALETGLSSDPAMNWRVSGLDRFLLVSNSDAHSPQKLGREANVFHVPPSYPDLARALRTKEGFGGTLEFFPQEGKYHLDGHRACSQRLRPEDSRRLMGLCPACGKPLTLGVMHRVLDLADRAPGEKPPQARPYESLIALPEILAETLAAGPNTKKVQQLYFRLLEQCGPELPLLRHASLEDLARQGGALLAHGVRKMRQGEVHIAGGYDGEYGVIRLFTPAERQEILGQGVFFSRPRPAPPPAAEEPAPSGPAESAPAPSAPEADAPGAARAPASLDPLLAPLNAAQRQAVLHQGPPLIVQAGPGAGKTRALTHRLAYLLARREVPPEEILAVTFTRQAAGEMAARLRQLVPQAPGVAQVAIKTFHALGYDMLLAQGGEGRQVADEARRQLILQDVARRHGLSQARLERGITLWKQALKYPEDLAADCDRAYTLAYRDYEAGLRGQNRWDYEDLIALPARLLASDSQVRQTWRRRFRHLLVDEYQDLNEAQYRLFRELAGPGAEIMVIGDPDQAIYGFRGASPAYFGRFRQDWPGASRLPFTETYRLPRPLLAASQALREEAYGAGAIVTHQSGEAPLVLLEAADAGAEARTIAQEITRLVGGLSHLALEDKALRHQAPQAAAGFQDIAVLYRIHALGDELERGLSAAGIPWQRPRPGLGPELDGLDLAAAKVKLLSLHAAKGLEFPYVFIAGCESGLMPWEPPGDFKTDLAEERRLFYVGLTRASCQVFLSRARRRSLFGQSRRPQMSPWVQQLPPGALARPELGGMARGQRQPALFPGIKGGFFKKSG
jgi:DNA helicase-2/ATP-dependent DNA helicase PcrA